MAQCEHCQTDFTPKHQKGRFCSTRCRGGGTQEKTAWRASCAVVRCVCRNVFGMGAFDTLVGWMYYRNIRSNVSGDSPDGKLRVLPS